MLKTFIRFSPVDYCLETNEECVVIPETEHCEDYFDSVIPAKAEDVISFILDKAEYNLFINAIHLRAALTSCGIVTELEIGEFSESTSQYFITCTLPTGTVNGSYEITIYKNYQMEITAFTPETSDGACDATFTVEIISQPAIDFEFSIDGITWNDTGVFAGLCMQPYTIYTREVGDTDCISGTLLFDASPLVCSDYKGFTLQEFIDSGIWMTQLAECTIDDLAP